jgi:hypothetical protein
VSRCARQEELLRRQRRALEPSDATLERVARGDRSPTCLPHAKRERPRPLDDAEERVLHHHQRLDLARPLVDGEHEGVAEELLRAVLLRVADAAVDLHVAAGDLDRLLGRQVLEKRRQAAGLGAMARQVASRASLLLLRRDAGEAVEEP